MCGGRRRKYPRRYETGGILLNPQAHLVHPILKNMSISASHLEITSFGSAPVTQAALDRVLSVGIRLSHQSYLAFPSERRKCWCFFRSTWVGTTVVAAPSNSALHRTLNRAA